MNKLWKQFLLEAEENNEIDLPSLEIKDTLNMNVWQSESRIKPEVGSRLIQIALDFIDSLDIAHEDVIDIVLTGSLANYNWTEYSDIDLHILMDYRDIDDNTDLVRDFFNAKKADWNKIHRIIIKEHEVEIYIQDINEPHISTGIYSLLEDQWLAKPSKRTPKIDYRSVEIKAKDLMNQIDKIKDLLEKENYEAAYNVGDMLRDKIKKLRRCGIMEKGVYSTENLVFKVLRNNEYIKKLLDTRISAYDNMMSLNHNAV